MLKLDSSNARFYSVSLVEFPKLPDNQAKL